MINLSHSQTERGRERVRDGDKTHAKAALATSEQQLALDVTQFFDFSDHFNQFLSHFVFRLDKMPIRLNIRYICEYTCE